MNLPNKLTILRMLLVPFFVLFILIDSIPFHSFFALLIFCAAAYTDRLDGKIARRDNLITNFGKLMDPLADKIMVMAALICFVKLDLASAACVIIIMFREFAVTSVRLLAAEQGKVIAANSWGKAKTVSQMCAIIAILIMQSLLLIPQLYGLESIFNAVGQVLIVFSTVLTLISGVIYISDNKNMIFDK